MRLPGEGKGGAGATDPHCCCQWPGCDHIGTYIVKRGLYGQWLYLCTPHRAKFQALANGEVRDTDWQERRYRKYSGEIT